MIELLTIPGVILIAGAILLSILPEKIRSTVFLIFPVAALAVVLTRPDGYTLTAALGSFELIVMEVDVPCVFGMILHTGSYAAGKPVWILIFLISSHIQ